MNPAQWQHKIDFCSGAEEMVLIAREYLKGTLIRDPVAAEAWLLRAIEADDPVHSPEAMGILAREVLRKDRVIPEEEIPELRSRAAAAKGREKEVLEALLKLV